MRRSERADVELDSNREQLEEGSEGRLEWFHLATHATRAIDNEDDFWFRSRRQHEFWNQGEHECPRVGLGAVLFEKSAWGAEIGALDEEDEVRAKFGGRLAESRMGVLRVERIVCDVLDMPAEMQW